ncbi:MAG TPA: hypothetical protein DDZ51_01530, partial [Planctomycetaceae bacterium]|nr:hypothetical protein [Planctomycetaceae bacterium]
MPSASLPRRVYARTPAKLNLFLELLSKRPDGYHEIETIMAAVSCYDTLRIDRTDLHHEIRLRTHWHPSPDYWQQTLGAGAKAILTIPDDETNLIHRSIIKMRTAFGIDSGFDVVARKRAPAGAGMGGASSDAAAAIVGVAALAGIRDEPTRLAQIASEVGSDVPFFLGPYATQTSRSESEKNRFSIANAAPQAAIARGRGELLSPFSLAKPIWFVVAYPPVALSTAAVYRVCQVPERPVLADEMFACLTSKESNLENFPFMNRLSQ